MTHPPTNPTGPGLFERLAARQVAPAAGRPGSLRPRIPYAFDHGLTASEPLDVVDAVREIVSPAAPEAPRGGSDAVRAPEAGRAQSGPTAPWTRQREAPPDTSEIRIAPARDVPETPEPAKQRTVSMGDGAPGGDASAPATRLEHRVFETKVSRVHTAERVVESRIKPEAGPGQAAAQRIRPVLPASPDVPPAMRAAKVAPGLFPATAARPPETVIEIHIGRLEVKAPAAPARPIAPAAAAPDDRLGLYLRSRARGARS